MAGGCKERGPLISTVDCDSVAVVHALVSSPSLSSTPLKYNKKREQENKKREQEQQQEEEEGCAALQIYMYIDTLCSLLFCV